MARVENLIRGFSAPGRYFQGPGILNQLCEYTALFGDKAFILVDSFFYEEYTAKYNELYSKAGHRVKTERFVGNSTMREIDRVTESAKAFGADVLVGIGGGKTLDTVKAASNTLGAPVICAPTTASTDAPCSGLSIIYKESGEYDHYIRYKSNPNIVLVDSEVICKAPVKYLIAGIGDALVTYYEAIANERNDSPNCVTVGYRRTRAGMAIARECYEVLMRDATAALISAKAGVCTQALENIIEANTLLSGIGFENTNVAGAHSVGDGFTILPDCDAKTLHGQRCGFGLICQLVAEGASYAEIEKILAFNVSVGLPVTIEEMGFEASEDNIRKIARQSMLSYWHNEPFYTDEQQVFNDIVAANAIGKQYLENHQ